MFEVGRSKRAEQAFAFDDITIVPSRRTRGEEEVSLSWRIDAYDFEFPLIAAPMDSVVSPATAILVGQLGGLGVLNLEGLWTRYDDPEPLLEEIAAVDDPIQATRAMQAIYAEPIKPELIGKRVAEIREAGVPAAGSLSPQNTQAYAQAVVDAGVDFFVIRGTTVSAEHVSSDLTPLNLKQFIYDLDVPVIVGGCATYQAALHLMRTGAAGVLVGVGPGNACTTRGVLGIGVPQATAIADVAGARRRHLEETGRYVHLIADGGMRTGGDIAKAIACGADAVMLGSPLARAIEAPGRGYHWGMATFHPELPRGARVEVGQIGSLEEILLGPAMENDGTRNLFGALRTSMATCGYEDIPAFHKAEVMVAPALQSEGKHLQRDQEIGMGATAAAAAAPTTDGIAADNGGGVVGLASDSQPETALVGD